MIWASSCGLSTYKQKLSFYTRNVGDQRWANLIKRKNSHNDAYLKLVITSGHAYHFPLMSVAFPVLIIFSSSVIDKQVIRGDTCLYWEVSRSMFELF